jgi:hypothetical protein
MRTTASCQQRKKLSIHPSQIGDTLEVALRGQSGRESRSNGGSVALLVDPRDAASLPPV